jgi:haloacetate dehalogenase
MEFDVFEITEHYAAATIDLVPIGPTTRKNNLSDPALMEQGQLGDIDILETWRSFAEDVRGFALDCSHFLPEEDPARTAAELIRFLAS